MTVAEIKALAEEMLEEQVRQGNLRNPQSFLDNIHRDLHNGGFNWPKSKKGQDYWTKLLRPGSLLKRGTSYFDPRPQLREYFKRLLEQNEYIIDNQKYVV